MPAQSPRFLVGSIVCVLAAALLSAAGCVTSHPVVSLRAHDPAAVWIDGRAVVAKEKEGVRVTAAFAHQDRGLLAVQLQVDNGAAEPVEIDPRQISFATCASLAPETCAPGRAVIDPEQALLALDRRASNEVGNANAHAALGGSLLFLGLVADIGSLAGGGRHHHPRITHHTSDMAVLMSADQAGHQQALARLEGERQRWTTLALHRSTIGPGQSGGGLVYLPINTRARVVWVQLRAGPRLFPFCFDQQVIWPNRAPTN